MEKFTIYMVSKRGAVIREIEKCWEEDKQEKEGGLRVSKKRKETDKEVEETRGIRTGLKRECL